MPVFNEKSRLSAVEEVQNENLVAMPEKVKTTGSSETLASFSPAHTAPPTPLDAVKNPFETDIEAMASNLSISKTSTRKSCNIPRKSDCQVWPGREHWVQKSKEEKKKRSCVCMNRLSRRNRLIVNILIGLVIVAVAMGVGFGVSKALHAPIWGKMDTQSQ